MTHFCPSPLGTPSSWKCLRTRMVYFGFITDVERLNLPVNCIAQWRVFWQVQVFVTSSMTRLKLARHKLPFDIVWIIILHFMINMPIFIKYVYDNQAKLDLFQCQTLLSFHLRFFYIRHICLVLAKLSKSLEIYDFTPS